MLGKKETRENQVLKEDRIPCSRCGVPTLHVVSDEKCIVCGICGEKVPKNNFDG
jgi:ribosomal protein L37E